MSARSYTTELLISVQPESVYDAITRHIDQWWTVLSNQAVQVGDQLTVRFEGNTSWVMTVIAARPNRTLAWKVADAHHDLDGITVKDEWGGTTIKWEISEHEAGSRIVFIHEGLVPELECYDICHAGWDYFLGSLKDFLETGSGNPFTDESAE